MDDSTTQFNTAQRSSKGLSPGILLILVLGVAVFMVLSQGDRADQPNGPAMPDGIPNADQHVEQTDWSIDTNANSIVVGSDTIPASQSSDSDWSIDTNAASSTSDHSVSSPTDANGQTNQGDWSIDTDVGKN